MVYEWRCQRCDYVVWVGSESAAVDSVQSHLFEHHRGILTKEAFQVGWHCPYCGEQRIQHDRREAVETFKGHLSEHLDEQVRSGVHVADDIGRAGNVLVLAEPESTGADNARIHFLSGCDVAIVVTADVSERLRLLAEQRSRWPRRTVVLTTDENPLDGLDGLDVSAASLEIVQLSKHMGLAEIGETISRVVAEHDDPAYALSVQFDVLSALIDSYQLKKLFRFLHLLTARLERSEALAHFYCNPETNSKPTINLLAELFDMTIRAEENRFYREE